MGEALIVRRSGSGFNFDKIADLEMYTVGVNIQSGAVSGSTATISTEIDMSKIVGFVGFCVEDNAGAIAYYDKEGVRIQNYSPYANYGFTGDLTIDTTARTIAVPFASGTEWARLNIFVEN